MSSGARRQFFTFEFFTLEDSSVRLEIGAYSVRQAWWLAHQSRRVLGVTTFYRSNWRRSRKSPGAPEGPFVMYKGEVLTIREGIV